MDTRIGRLLQNYSNARKSWETWCYFVNFDCINENRSISARIDSNPLLYHLRYLALKDFYIEAYKVLKHSKNNADNIYALLNDQRVDVKKVVAIYKCLKEFNAMAGVIQQICDTRDKYYAHLDEDHHNYIAGIGLHKIVQVFVAIENAIMVLTSSEMLQEYLDKIPSRNDFNLDP